ncbi:MAG: hypothetical protein AAGD07_10830 [Planctomycetota bacterium]
MIAFGKAKRRHVVVRWFGFTIAGLCVLGACATARMWQRYQDVPEFYRRATNQTVQDRRLARHRLRQSLEQMQQAASSSGRWSVNFDEQTINVWLSEQLPRRFFRLYRVGAREPVVAMEDGRLHAAVQYKKGHWDTVISCELEVEMTEAANVLAVRMLDLKAGSIPLPIEPFVRNISREAQHGDVMIDWDFTDRGPIAMVQVPFRHEGYHVEPIVVESVRVDNRHVKLSGLSGPRARSAFKPRGPLHRFVSYQPTTADEADKYQPDPTLRARVASKAGSRDASHAPSENFRR